jgi:hypothetical protein
MNDELRVRQIGPFAFWGRKGEYMMEVADRLVVGYVSKGVSFGYRRRDLGYGCQARTWQLFGLSVSWLSPSD